MDSLGRPASGAGRIVDDGGAEVARFRTEHAGRARLTFTPRGGVRYACVLDDGTEAELPAVKRDGVVLASLADAHPAASPVALRIRTTRDERHTVAVFCRGVCVASAVTEGAGVHDVALAVPEEVFGVLRVTVFDAEMRPRAERLVQRLPAQRLAVELSPRHATRAPGERQAIAVTTTDERGRPRSAAIGLVVTDHAVRALAGEPRIGLLDRTALLGDVAVPEDLADFLLETEGAPARVDLLLGTLGWRRFVWVPGSDELASADVTRARALEGAGSVVIEHSTARDDTAEIDAAARATRRAKEIALVTLMLSAIAMLVLGATLGAAWLARRLEWSGTPRGKLLVAGPILAAGIVVLSMLAAPGAIGSRFAAGDAMEAAPLDRVGIAGAWRDAPRFGGAELADAFRFFAFAPVDEAAAQPEAEELEGNLRAGGGLAVDLYVTHDTVVREYAHRHHGAEGRSDFTETVYWNALLVTDESGRTEIEFDLSDRVTTWDVEASAHGAGRVGQGRARFDTRLPFFLEAKLPVELTAGDRVDVPVALVAEGGGPAEAEVRARAAGAVRTDGGEHQRVVLEAGRGRALVPLVAGEPTESPTRIDVVAAAGRFRDAVRKDVRVVPRGFPHRRSWAGTLGAEASELVVAMPVRGGTPSLVLKVFPSPLSTLREGLDGILGEPHGCFEQASSSNYPNTLVLSYLEASGDVVPEVSARARELLPRGYELITSYECRERGYEWFGGDPGHEALTAYGLVQFEDMRRVFDVDADMLARTRAWLLARRDGSGSFARNPRALDRFGSAPAETTDAYVVFALLYAGEPAAELAAELARLEERATNTDDAYELAVAACAFTRAERAESARAACARLASMQREDGALAGKASITRSGERDLVVETTSFAVLAWLAHGDEHLARARKACEFLQTQQSARGTFGATQATIMALKALTELARSRRTLPTHGSIRVFRGDELLVERAFASSDPDAIELELARTLGPGEHRLSLVLEADGEAHLPWACDLAYHADRPADDPEAVIAIDTSIDAAEVTEGDSVAVRVRVRNTTPDGQPMTVANVGLPAALEAPVEVLDAQRDAGAYDLWEIRGRTLTFYWRALEPSAERAFVIDCVARLPGATTGPASSAYLYYTPDARRWAAPMSVITR